nr:tetratricopeptide repeat protein [uncultured Albidiferax sp.]
MAQTAHVTGNHNTVVQIAGDHNTVVLGRAFLTLTRFEGQRHSNHPLSALSPYSRSTHLLGRDDELASLRAFLSSPQPISVRVMVGGGGSGKTRLALALCDQMQADGWDAGFVTSTEAERFFAGQNLSAWGWQKPTLVVVDDAAAKAQALGRWLDELADRTAPTPHPLRILLLERSADPSTGWWGSVFGGGWQALAKQALLVPPVPVPLHPLATPALRLALLQDMLAIARPKAHVALPVDDPAFGQQLMQPSWGGDPLFLMLAAMAMASQGHSALTLGRTDLADRVAQGEIDRITRLAQAQGLTPELVLHLAACATLAQGLTRAAFLPLAAAEQQATGWTQPDAPAALFKLLQQALPGPQGIAPVIPDMVGEALLVRLLPGDEGKEAVLRCYTALGHRVAETVIRCVQDFAEVAAGPLGWLGGIVDTAQDDVEALAALANSLPMDSLALNATSLRVFQAVLERLAAMPDANPLACGTAWMNLSRAQAYVHQLAPALASAVQAVLLLYPLAQQQPGKYTFHLAMALNGLALRQSAMGQYDEALETAQETVLQVRNVARSTPDGADSLLAMVLTNLSQQQSRLGQHGPALASAQQAVALYTRLAEQLPAEFTEELATAISNLGVAHGNAHEADEALHCALQVANIYRRLAAQQPDTYRPALAIATTNLACAYSLLAQHGAALEAARECMAQHTLLAAQNPDRFTPLWARSLGLLAQCLLDLQQVAPARDHAHHGLQLLIPSFLQHPELHHAALSALLRTYLRACEANNVKPDAALIEPLLPFIAEAPN